MTGQQSPEAWVRDHAARDQMTEAEAEVVWTAIEAHLTQEAKTAAPAPPAQRAPWRRFAPLAVAGTLAATVLLAYALLPIGSDSERSQRVLYPGLETASAAEVLEAAADSASRQRSLMPAAGEVLFWSTSFERPSDPPASHPRIVREWIDSRGQGRRVEVTEVISGGIRDLNRTVTRFTADRPDPSIQPGESWRAFFGISQLAALPATPAPLLDRLREQVAAGAGENATLDEGEDELLGVDFITLISAVQLLAQAPLESDQRAALFEVLMSAPDWNRSDGAATLSIRNLGTETTADGSAGNRLQVMMEVKASQAGGTGIGPGVWKLDLIVDPGAGEVIAMHEYDTDDREPQIITIRDLEVIPAP